MTIDAIGANGAAVAVSLKGVTLAEVDASLTPVAGGCSAVVTAAKISGTITQVGGGAGGGGGGGAGGGGTCPSGVGE